jgi:hypothetical protein
MSNIDGRKVEYFNNPQYAGLVIGDSVTEGFVRVQWEKPSRHIGIHRVAHLKVVDVAPSQEDLSNQYYARGTDGKRIPLQES